MILLAIDPGTTKSGVVIFDGTNIFFREKVSNEYLRELILLGEIKYDRACIEGIACNGGAVGREVFETCYWIGRLIECIMSQNIIPKIMYRREVKNYLCPKIKSNDAVLRAAVIKILGEPGTKKNPGPTYGVTGDVWQALALALTFFGTKEIK